jgi:hypothetical protein
VCGPVRLDLLSVFFHLQGSNEFLRRAQLVTSPNTLFRDPAQVYDSRALVSMDRSRRPVPATLELTAPVIRGREYAVAVKLALRKSRIEAWSISGRGQPFGAGVTEGNYERGRQSRCEISPIRPTWSRVSRLGPFRRREHSMDAHSLSLTALSILRGHRWQPHLVAAHLAKLGTRATGQQGHRTVAISCEFGDQQIHKCGRCASAFVKVMRTSE